MDSLHDKSSFISRLALIWVIPLVRRLHKAPQNEDNLEPIPIEDNLNFYLRQMNQHWNEEKIKSKPNFGIVMLKSFKK